MLKNNIPARKEINETLYIWLLKKSDKVTKYGVRPRHVKFKLP
jgi:hypothetical protein